MDYFVIAESLYKENQFLSLFPYRKNKRTQYRFQPLNTSSEPAKFKDPQIALNYGERASLRLSPQVLDEKQFQVLVKDIRDFEIDRNWDSGDDLYWMGKDE
ncbi:hypothetical protein [Leptospira johnsonii]|uniref:Uncharacterized protein n=1 Tax=Leptospira johnsonii TaxID=1917820 RepID=A0A2P2D7Q2_9LEPT|nr:hypothetical protein [Leptospira johnsonii]GBF40665.1 hypothetical protein LPTSP1_36830 [Leptospira johnsonii]